MFGEDRGLSFCLLTRTRLCRRRTQTEKSMAELNVELNKTFEFDKITEAGANLAPLTGPGYMGLKNLGNSCYMNSVMQVCRRVALWNPSHRSRVNSGQRFNGGLDRGAPMEC